MEVLEGAVRQASQIVDTTFFQLRLFEGERYRRLILSQAFLGVSGKVQAREGVVHLVAERFWKPRLGRPATPRSRDFR